MRTALIISILFSSGCSSLTVNDGQYKTTWSHVGPWNIKGLEARRDAQGIFKVRVDTAGSSAEELAGAAVKVAEAAANLSVK